MTIFPNYDGVKKASLKLKGLIRVTPLDLNKRLSNSFGASIFLKERTYNRSDLLKLEVLIIRSRL